VEAARINEELSKSNFQLEKSGLQSNVYKALQEYNKWNNVLNYYETQALTQADILVKTANLNYANGEINYLEWVTLVNKALNIKLEYINALYQQQLSEIELNYLLQNN
jgi:cobalt-zinc-cadmium resistance protein CzcA